MAFPGMEDNDGEEALLRGEIPGVHSGMTLRDWFAGQIMSGVSGTTISEADTVKDLRKDFKRVVAGVYECADMMMEERELKMVDEPDDGIQPGHLYSVVNPPDDKPGLKGEAVYIERVQDGLVLARVLGCVVDGSHRFEKGEWGLEPLSAALLTSQEKKSAKDLGILLTT